MNKYTINYCKYNFVAIRCPTLEIYQRVKKVMKISSKLRDNLWSFNKEKTMISYTFNSDRPKPYAKDDCCFGTVFAEAEIIDGEKFLEDNGVYITENYQIY